MPNPGRPRISTGIHESKTLALYNAGRALLAERDYEAISVAQIAKVGRCSVGAFYVRFPDKAAFLSFVIRHSFDFAARSFADSLVNGGIKAVGVPAKAQLAASLLAKQFADPEFAGALRAAFKQGFTEPQCRKPLDLYRDAITDHLSGWLADDRAKHRPEIHCTADCPRNTDRRCALRGTHKTTWNRCTSECARFPAAGCSLRRVQNWRQKLSVKSAPNLRAKNRCRFLHSKSRS